MLRYRIPLLGALLAAALAAGVLGGRILPVRAQAALAISQTDGSTLVVEGGASDTYAVSLVSAPTGPVTVTATPQSARLDLGAGPGVAIDHVFALEAWDQVWQVTVSAPDDAVAGENADVEISHVATGGGYDGVPAGTVAVTVQDDDSAGVDVQPTSLTVSEPDGSTGLTISLTSQPTADVAIPVSTGSDEIQVAPASVTLTPGNWSVGVGVTVTAIDDSVADGTQSAQVTLGPAQSADATYDGWTIPAVGVQVQDDDAAGVDVSPAAVGVTEGGTAASYSLALTSQSTGDVVITATPQSGQIALGGAAPGSPVTRTFTPGNWAAPQSIAVQAVDDAVAEAPLEASIAHAAIGGGYDGVAVASVAVTVTDDDTPGILVAPTSLSISEPAGSADVVISLTSQPTADVAIPVSTGSDEIQVSPATVTLTAGNWATGASVTVTAVDDAVADGTQSAQMSLGPTQSADGAYDGRALPAVSVQVADDDVAGVVVAPQDVDVAEGGPPATYTLVLTSEPTGDVTITAGVAGGQVGLVGAGAGGGVARTFTPQNWSTPQSIAVEANDDAVAEGTQVATIEHTASGGGYGGIPVATVGVTVADDDEAGFVVEPAGLSVIEAGASASLTISLTSQPTASVTIPVGTGSGQIGVSPGSVVLGVGNWDTGASVTVTAVDDAVADGTQSTQVILGPAQSQDAMYDDLALDPVPVQVLDNDTAGVDVDPQDVSVLEGGAAVPYSLVLTSQPTGNVVITATPQSAQVHLVGAGPGAPVTRTFTPQNWSTPQSISVQAVDDAVAEGPHTTTIAHAASGGGYGSVGIAATTVRVTDNDSAGIYIAPTGLTVSEPDGSASVAISLTSQPTANVTIPVSTASDEISVSPSTVTLTPGAWPTGVSVTVTAIDDAVADGTQTAQVSLGPTQSADGNYDGRTISPVQVQVQDDDAAGVIVAPDALDIPEGGTAAYTVVLTSQPQGLVVVTVTPSVRLDVGQGPGASQLLAFSAEDWDDPRTVTVTAVNNLWAEGERTETIVHAVEGGEYDDVSVASVAVTVADDDVAGLTVDPTSLAISEPDGSASLVVALTSEPRAAVQVPVSTASDEIQVSPATVTLTAGNWATGASVTVTAVDDAVADGAQSAQVTLGPAQSADGMYNGRTLPAVQIQVADDDVAGVLVQPEELSVVEGGPPATYTLVLTSQPTGDVTVTASVAGGEVELAGGVTRTFTAQNWATPQPVVVQAVDNTFLDGHRSATVVHTIDAPSEYAGLSVGPVVVSVADNDMADVSIAPLSLHLVEGGADGVYTLSLTARPEATVSVDVHPDEGLDVGSGSGQTLRLAIPAEDWHLPQAVTVLAVDDDVAGDTREAWIAHQALGGGYTDVAVERVRVVIEDNDRPGIRVSPGEIVVSEPDGMADLTISLATRPGARVRIPLEATTDRCRVVPDAVELDPGNWRGGEPVTVQAIDDRVRTGDEACGIRVGPATSADPRYDGLSVPDVPVTVLDDEPDGPMTLPLVMLGRPPVLGGPVLDPIANPDGDGAYEVTWGAVAGAEVYLVEESSGPAFADARLVYEGAEPHVAIGDRGAGRLWYRVRSRVVWGALSGWSGPGFVDILWEREPNDAAQTQANGPLVPDLVYRGSADGAEDAQDYYLVVLGQAAALDVRLAGIPEGQNSDLVLRDAALGLVGYSGELGSMDEHISTGVLPAGRYYVQVYHRAFGGGSGAYALSYTTR